jgi:hypothetical protein
MASTISILLEIFHASGPTTNSLKITNFILRHPKLLFMLHFKIVPAVLDDVSDQGLYADIISKISVGRTYKTTNFERHRKSDDIIIDIIKKSGWVLTGASFADIGVSDGSGSIYLIDQLAAINIQTSLFDKYLFLKLRKSWYGDQYINEDGFIVGVKLIGIYIYCFPLHIKSDMRYDSSIKLINPAINERNLTIKYFDIFSSQSNELFSFVKVANVLNLCYFGRQEILNGLTNLHRNIANNGYLFIIHNHGSHESCLVLRKSDDIFSVEYAYQNPELLDLAQDNCIILES